MAKPISFIPKQVDPKLELQRRLAAAPEENAEALLVAYELLNDAHRAGMLDALHGFIAAKDTVFGTLAHYAAEPASTNALRNLLALGKILGTIDPEPISKLSKEMGAAMESHQREPEPPTLWQLFKRMREPETRRGLSLMTRLLAALGRAS